ncbi:hypothetical protein Vadar_015460 [Vaccinium darrowii]|uniref:Uncharacterized protein n=1 Tax=Vaccinium darrowii TaxID=229202 RepID=A0ACB7X0Y1_9ERIC|nr:hypothetical protein Vadar_015460 [Vaccinium darrowii]
MKFLFLQCFILTILFFASTTLSSGSKNRTLSSPPSAIHFTDRAEVHIRSDLPNNTNPLYFRCQSKDTDFGMRKLNVGEEFYWKFRLQVWGRTLYFCHFYWGNRQSIFNVYDKYSVRYLCAIPGSDDLMCIWKVREEAFYVSHDNKRKDAVRVPLIGHVVVHIYSRVPNQPSTLKIHCQSKDTDFGEHFLKTDDQFYWRFVPHLTGTTLFFCQFNWGSKSKTFDVYNSTIDDICSAGVSSFASYNCFWEARPDGFYLSNDNKIWQKLNTWT